MKHATLTIVKTKTTLIVCGSETKKDNKYEAKSRNICRNVKHVKLQNIYVTNNNLNVTNC